MDLQDLGVHPVHLDPPDQMDLLGRLASKENQGLAVILDPQDLREKKGQRDLLDPQGRLATLDTQVHVEKLDLQVPREA